MLQLSPRFLCFARECSARKGGAQRQQRQRHSVGGSGEGAAERSGARRQQGSGGSGSGASEGSEGRAGGALA